MSKKLFKTIFVFLCVFLMINNVHADSLKQLKEKLARDEANKAALIAEQRRVQSKVRAANNDVAEINKKIEENQNKITESKEKIKELKKILKRNKKK